MKQFYLLSFLICFLNYFAQNKPVTVIPCELENNGIYIYCTVNQQDSIKMMFDTGSDGSVINKKSFHKLNLDINSQSLNVGANGRNMVDRSTGNTVSFGNIERKNVGLTIIPYETTEFDGVFGTDLMMGNIIEIDYNKKEIRFYHEDEKNLNLKNYVKMKLTLIDNYPAVKSSFFAQDKKYSGFFGLDTGADDALTILAPFSKKNNIQSKTHAIGSATALGSDGTEVVSPIVLIPEIEFSKKKFYNISAMLSNAQDGIDASEKMAGIYGNNFLKRFNTIIDFKRKVIYFKPNKNLYSEIY